MNVFPEDAIGAGFGLLAAYTLLAGHILLGLNHPITVFTSLLVREFIG